MFLELTSCTGKVVINVQSLHSFEATPSTGPEDVTFLTRILYAGTWEHVSETPADIEHLLREAYIMVKRLTYSPAHEF